MSTSQRERLPVERPGITHKVEITDEETGQKQEGYIIANVYPDGRIGEVFLHGFAKSGSTLEGWTQLAALLLSISIQTTGDFPVLAKKISAMKFPPYGRTDNPDIPTCRSVPDYIVQWLALHFGDSKLREEMK